MTLSPVRRGGQVSFSGAFEGPRLGLNEIGFKFERSQDGVLEWVSFTAVHGLLDSSEEPLNNVMHDRSNDAFRLRADSNPRLGSVGRR